MPLSAYVLTASRQAVENHLSLTVIIVLFFFFYELHIVFKRYMYMWSPN